MNSGDPYSPTRRGPPRQAYQYVFVVPSASLATVQSSPLALMRMLLFHPTLNFVVARRLGGRGKMDGNAAGRRIDLDAVDIFAGKTRGAESAGHFALFEPIHGAVRHGMISYLEMQAIFAAMVHFASAHRANPNCRELAADWSGIGSDWLWRVPVGSSRSATFGWERIKNFGGRRLASSGRLCPAFACT